MKSGALALLLLLPVLPACRSTSPVEDPERTTIIYQRGVGASGRGKVQRIVLTTEASSPHLAGSGQGILGRHVQPGEMADILEALGSAGLFDLPSAQAAAGGPAPPRSVTIESEGMARTWIGRLEQLNDKPENLATFARVERTLVNWSRATRVGARTR